MVQLAGEEYLTRKEVQDILHVSRQTLVDWMHKGQPPKVYKLGSRVYYKKSDVDAVMQEVIVDGAS